ncbi:MAG TPA: glycosyltransferase family 4 protein [Ktedonobacteraceae bacterium]|nr:glycosyltransferase family 4 protein [Ktedonobacteraceae bacterium]
MAITGKVLIVLENRPALIDTRILVEATTLRDQNFEVCVISPRDTPRKGNSYLCLEGIHFYSYYLPRFRGKKMAYLFEYSWSMLKIWWISLWVLYRHGFDVIHAANPPDIFFFLYWFYRFFGKRFIFDQHDLSLELFQVKFGKRHKFLQRILLWLEKCSYRTAACVLTTNESQRQIAVTRGKCDPEKVFVVRNGPDLQRLYSVPTEPELKKGRSFLLVYIGAMEVQDGVHYALYALHELIHVYKRRDILFVLMGDGSRLPDLKKLAEELHIGEYVSFTGWVGEQEIRRYLSTADIGLCPDPLNGVNEFCTTIKAMEYMAMSLPIVAFDLVETRYTTREAALYATPNSVHEFAGQINRLLDDPELREAMGKHARHRVEKCLSWNYARQHLLHAYATLFPALTIPAASESICME